MNSTPRWRKVLFGLVALSFSAGVSFFLLEALAGHLERRDAETQRQTTARLSLMRPNPAGTGSYRHRPNIETVALVRGHRIPIHINSHGMRWHEVSVAKPRGTQRIAFFGDSFTFGCWADDIDSTYVGAFARSLNPERFEILNFGVGGYGLDDIELQLEEEAISFAPDFVIIMLFNGNDFRDTYFGIHKYRLVDGTAEWDPEVIAAKLPEYKRESEPFALRPAPDPSRLRRRLLRFAAFRLLLPALDLDNPWIEFRPSPYFTSFSYWSQYPYPKVARRALDETLATLERMHAFAAEHGARLAIVTIPFREQVYAATETGTFFDIDLPQAYVRVFAREKNIPFLDLLRKLRPHVLATHERLYLPGDIHFNTEGHLLVARFVREWFINEVSRRARP